MAGPGARPGGSDFGTKAMPLRLFRPRHRVRVRGAEPGHRCRCRDGGPAARSSTQIGPSDPNLLPGAANVVEPDGPKGAEPGEGYIWDAALRRGLTFRDYGSFGDTRLEVPLVGPAYAKGQYPGRVRQSRAAEVQRPLLSRLRQLLPGLLASITMGARVRPVYQERPAASPLDGTAAAGSHGLLRLDWGLALIPLT